MPFSSEPALILLLALLLDRLFGDPPDRFHTTAWMGRLTEYITVRPLGPKRVWGILILLAVAGIFSGAAFLLMTVIGGGLSGFLAGALILKLQIGWRSLGEMALPVGSLVAKDDLPGARMGLSRIVGRDTGSLDESGVLSGAVETVGENTSDSIISPLFYFLLVTPILGTAWGVAAAVFFRAVNTLDAMLGYRTESLRDLGWAPARADDILNFVPARVSALLLVFSSFLLWRTGGRSLATLKQDHSNPASPNSGWPMAALAGGLGVRLENPGKYVIGDGFQSPIEAEKIREAVRTVDLAVMLFAVLSLAWLAAV